MNPSPPPPSTPAAGWSRALRWLWPALVLTVLVAVVAVNVGGPGSDRTPVRLSQVTKGSLSVEILATGTVEPMQRLEVRWPFAAALVSAVLVEPGERVHAGQPLLRLDSALLEETALRESSAYLAARDRLDALLHGSRDSEQRRLEISLERARRELDHQVTRQQQVEELHQAGLLSRMDRDAAVFQVDSARYAVRQAEVDLEAFRRGFAQGEEQSLREEVEARRLVAERARQAAANGALAAEADATVLEVHAQTGEQVQEGQLAFLLADMRRFRISLLVDELEVRRIRPGQRVTLDSEYFGDGGGDGSGDGGVEGVVERVVPMVRDRRGVPSVEVRVTVTSPGDWEPPAGLGVEARIRVDRADGVVTVPLESVVERDGTNGVFVVDGGWAHFQPVGLGLRNERRVEVASGVEPGQQVIVGGHVFLQDGDPVVAVQGSSNGSLKVEFFQ